MHIMSTYPLCSLDLRLRREAEINMRAHHQLPPSYKGRESNFYDMVNHKVAYNDNNDNDNSNDNNIMVLL